MDPSRKTENIYIFPPKNFSIENWLHNFQSIERTKGRCYDNSEITTVEISIPH